MTSTPAPDWGAAVSLSGTNGSRSGICLTSQL